MLALLLFTTGCSDKGAPQDNNSTPPTETNGPDPTPPIPSPEESVKLQKVILPFSDPSAGIEPWITDGMPDGTTERLGDFNTRPAPLRSGSTKAIAKFKGKTYLLATDSNSKSGLWKDDGTGRDLQLILPFSALGNCMTAMGDKLYFLAVDTDGNTGLWQSDCTENGTRLIYALNTYYVTSSSAAMLTVDNTLFLSTRGNLYVSDGTEEGTKKIKYLRYSRYPAEMVRSGAYVYITANEYSNQRLWRTDGTETGTIELVHLGRNASIGELTDINNTLFFVQKDGTYGSELWRTDGTKDNTKLVKDIRNGSTGSNPSHLTVFHNKLYFFANDGNGTALWESNGTLEGTSAVLSAAHGNAMTVMN
jgi:ELWxxDGT repeat protein